MHDVKKIIIFDDDEDILAICTFILESEGWEVTTFTDCNDPVEKITGNEPDVIMMDNWIPDTGGVIATQLLKNDPALRHIPVIYFSANCDLAKLAQNAGADTWLSKPFDIAELNKAIHAVLKKS